MDQEEPISMEGAVLGFLCLIGFLHGKGVIDMEEFADMLDNSAPDRPPRDAALLKPLAAALRLPKGPILSVIHGGKDDDPSAA